MSIGWWVVVTNLTAELEQVVRKAQKVRRRLGQVRDQVVRDIYRRGQEITEQAVRIHRAKGDLDRKIDNIVTSRILGYPLMLALLSLVFWLTISGANLPSAILAEVLFGFQDRLTALCQWLGAPTWLHGVLVLGYTVVWPGCPGDCRQWPFSFLCLLSLRIWVTRPGPSIWINSLRKLGPWQQVLTMCMGFGCNAAVS